MLDFHYCSQYDRFIILSHEAEDRRWKVGWAGLNEVSIIVVSWITIFHLEAENGPVGEAAIRFFAYMYFNRITCPEVNEF